LDANYFRVLFAYNSWANELVLSQAARVSETEYYASFPGLSFGSLHATLVHIFVAELVWLARWKGHLPPEPLKDARHADELARTEIKTFQDLRLEWPEQEEQLDAFLARLRDEDVDKPLRYETQYGEPNEQPLSQLMAHVINHGTQFRAEAAVRLTQLGHSPGDFDLIVYIRQLKE
jgi:uncharacterized damage-inducible protein DinB